MDRLDRLRARYRWLDHLIRAGQRYQVNNGDHYAAAVTYFSVLALVPLMMIALAAAGFVLAAQPELLAELKAQVAASVPGELGKTINDAIDEAVDSRAAVGLIGLAIAAYSSLGWMGNLREALTAQWSLPHRKVSFARTKAADVLALAGLGLALVVSFTLTAAGSAFATEVLELLGLAGQRWAHVLLVAVTVLLALLGNWLVFAWVIARLPREPVTLRSAAKAALAGAIGFEVLKQLGTLYLRSLGGSPAAAVFGPVLGLLVFVYLVSRFLLFLAAWAATAKENAQRNRAGDAPPAPPPAMIRPNITVRGGPGRGTTAGLIGAGTVIGAGLVALGRRRRRGS